MSARSVRLVRGLMLPLTLIVVWQAWGTTAGTPRTPVPTRVVAAALRVARIRRAAGRDCTKPWASVRGLRDSRGDRHPPGAGDGVLPWRGAQRGPAGGKLSSDCGDRHPAARDPLVGYRDACRGPDRCLRGVLPDRGSYRCRRQAGQSDVVARGSDDGTGSLQTIFALSLFQARCHPSASACASRWVSRGPPSSPPS